MRTLLPTLLIAILGLLAARPASAATFSVNPTQIFLSGRTTTALLTVKNDSTEPVRFQLSAFAWQQSDAGELQLSPTSDVVFFPALVTLGPKEERKIRVGVTAAAAPQERTYRIFVEELPGDAGEGGGAAVRVLTKMGVPIFIRPARETTSAQLTAPQVNSGTLAFSVANTGSVHFIPNKVQVRALGQSGDVVFERDLQAWYILAGGARDFTMEMPAADCARVASLEVRVAIDQTVLEERLQTADRACAK